MRIKA